MKVSNSDILDLVDLARNRLCLNSGIELYIHLIRSWSTIMEMAIKMSGPWLKYESVCESKFSAVNSDK